MDHNTKQREMVISRITQRFEDTLREWAQEASDSRDISLERLEGKVQDGLHVLGGEILQELVGLVGTGKTEEPAQCPECGEPLDFVRYQGKWVETLLDTIRPERTYFHCSGCHRVSWPKTVVHKRSRRFGSNNLKVLSILSDAFSNGCLFLARTGVSR